MPNNEPVLSERNLRVAQLLRGAFDVLSYHPEGLTIRNFIRRLEVVVPPTESEREMVPRSHFTWYYQRVRMAMTKAKYAGWMKRDDKTQVWSPAEEGLRMLAMLRGLDEFARELQHRHLLAVQHTLLAGEEANRGCANDSS